MQNFDLTSLAGVAAFVTMLIGALKKLFPKWVDGKEPLLAVIFPVVIVVVLKLTGGAFGSESWVNAIIGAIASGLGAGVVHDKIVNPVIRGVEKTDQ